MRVILICLLLTLALAGCLDGQSASVVPPERLVIDAPSGYRIAGTHEKPGEIRRHFRPIGESDQSWTRLIGIVITEREPVPDMGLTLVEAELDGALACAITPFMEPPRIFTLDGNEAALVYWACGKRRADGGGEVALAKFIEGRTRRFQIVWLWNLSETADSRSMTPPPGAREEAERFLETLWVCDIAKDCPGVRR